MPFNDTRGFVLPAACALVLALSGCGGGGGTGTTPPSGRSMAQLESEPVALPEGVTLATAGTFTVEPGRSVDRDGARFTCAAGGAACTVVVAERAGGGFAATVTGGRVMIAAARLPESPGGGGQNGGMEERDLPFPDWPVADAAAFRSLMGGSALSWSPSETRNRLTESITTGTGPAEPPYGISIPGAPGSIGSAGYCTHGRCDEEYQPVMTYHDIPIVQARIVQNFDSSDPRYMLSGIFGILAYGYFGAWVEVLVGEDFQTIHRINGYSSGEGTWVTPHGLDLPDFLGRWRGALVGTGWTTASTLHRQFFMGDVDVVVTDFVFTGEGRHPGLDYTANLEFSNVRNTDTGETITLPRTRWSFHFHEGDFNVDQDETDESPTPNDISMYFLGPNAEEILGSFEFEEFARGAFGAKKQ